MPIQPCKVWWFLIRFRTISEDIWSHKMTPKSSSKKWRNSSKQSSHPWSSRSRDTYSSCPYQEILCWEICYSSRVSLLIWRNISLKKDQTTSTVNLLRKSRSLKRMRISFICLFQKLRWNLGSLSKLLSSRMRISRKMSSYFSLKEGNVRSKLMKKIGKKRTNLM